MKISRYEEFKLNEDQGSELQQQKAQIVQQINDLQKKLLDINQQILNGQKATIALNPQAQIPVQENETHQDHVQLRLVKQSLESAADMLDECESDRIDRYNDTDFEEAKSHIVFTIHSAVEDLDLLIYKEGGGKMINEPDDEHIGESTEQEHHPHKNKYEVVDYGFSDVHPTFSIAFALSSWPDNVNAQEIEVPADEMESFIEQWAHDHFSEDELKIYRETDDSDFSGSGGNNNSHPSKSFSPRMFWQDLNDHHREELIEKYLAQKDPIK